MTTYVAGWNAPGTLPESEPQRFDTVHEAVSYLVDTVDRFWDEDSDGPEPAIADDRWLPVHTELHNAPGVPWSVINGDQSLAFWIEIEENNK